MGGKRSGRVEYFLAGLAAAAAFLVYLPVLQNRFVYWDDQKYIYENPHIRSFGSSFLKWAFLGFHSASVGNWLPLTWVSFALDHAIWGLDPAGYHLTNIVLHSANTFLVVLLSVRVIEVMEVPPSAPHPWTSHARRGPGVRDNFGFLEGKGKLITGVTTGLLFGLHPLHVESVAWASERKDVICGLFYLLSILAYLNYAARLKGPVHPEKSHYAARPYLLSLAFFFLALMSKPMAVSLPLVLLVLDWHPLERIFSFKSFRAAFTEKLPFIILSGGGSVLAIMAQKKGGTIMSLDRVPFSERGMVSARSLILYLCKMVLPVDLIPYYPYPQHVSFFSAGFFLPTALVALVTAFCLAMAKRQRLWLACWGYFVITLLPVIGLVQVGEQAMADRYTYLPSLGPFFAAGVAAAWSWNKAGTLKRGHVLRGAGAAIAILAAILASYLTFKQIGVWKNSLALWNYVIKKEPGKIPVAYENRGVVLADMGQTGRAIPDYIKAISLDPSFFEAHYNLARAFAETGHQELAIAEYKQAISLDPSYPDTYNDIGVVLARTGRLGLALRNFSAAILLDPANAEFLINRGKIYSMSGLKAPAIADFRKACGMGDEDGCRALRASGF